MSISGAAKTVVDSAYAYRFIRLLQKDFSEWEAFKHGLIDDKGNVIKRPKTEIEKSSYTPFHGAVRSVKRMLRTVPFANSAAYMTGSISAIGSRFGLTEAEMQIIEDGVQPLLEEMVAGDAGGNPTNIASGTTTGAIVNKGPETIKKRKKKV